MFSYVNGTLLGNKLYTKLKRTPRPVFDTNLKKLDRPIFFNKSETDYWGFWSGGRYEHFIRLRPPSLIRVKIKVLIKMCAGVYLLNEKDNLGNHPIHGTLL